MNPKSEMSTLDKIALKKAIKETPSLRVGVSVPKSMNKGFSDTPLFSLEKNQTKLW
jgi:hypothetical protein